MAFSIVIKNGSTQISSHSNSSASFSITYNGKTIATVNSNTTKTLNTASKFCIDNIKIDTKTLGTKGKFCKNNISVTATKTIAKGTINITDLSYALTGRAAAPVGNYAVFAGGQNSGGYDYRVRAYDTSLTLVSASNLGSGSSYKEATSNGSYAIFLGGTYNYNSGWNVTAECYSSSLTRSTVPSGGDNNTEWFTSRNGATRLGKYALFSGRNYIEYNLCLAIDTSLTVYRTKINEVDQYNAAASIGNYAIFGGGQGDWYGTNYTNAVDSSLTLVSSPTLSVSREGLVGISFTNHALFGGGFSAGGNYYNTVDTYDASLTKGTATGLSAGRTRLAGTVLASTFALFGGGESSSKLATVDAYNTSLTRSVPSALSEARSYLCATYVGNYAIFNSGITSSGETQTTDTYQY